MSSHTLGYLTSNDLEMLARVLDTAGIFDLPTSYHRRLRLLFARKAIDLFEDGLTSEAALVDAIVSQIDVLGSTFVPVPPRGAYNPKRIALVGNSENAHLSAPCSRPAIANSNIKEYRVPQPVHILDFANLAMINRILYQQGYRGTPAEVDGTATDDAAQFLLDRFHRGVNSEKDLASSLEQRGRSLEHADDTPAQVMAAALDRWDNEGGSARLAEVQEEKPRHNKSWTGRTMRGAISEGAVLYISQVRYERDCILTFGDTVSLSGDREAQPYSVTRAVDGNTVLRTSGHTLKIKQLIAGHPASGQQVEGIGGECAWIIRSIRNLY